MSTFFASDSVLPTESLFNTFGYPSPLLRFSLPPYPSYFRNRTIFWAVLGGLFAAERARGRRLFDRFWWLYSVLPVFLAVILEPGAPNQQATYGRYVGHMCPLFPWCVADGMTGGAQWGDG